jgi:excisionase family DNA binding protein
MKKPEAITKQRRMQMDEILLDIEQVAKLLNFSKSFVYKLVRSGRLRAMRMGAHLRISRSEVNRYQRESEEDGRPGTRKGKDKD